MRTADEIRAARDRYKAQAREYRSERDTVEAAACSIVVSALSWVLGEKDEPTMRVKL